MGKPRGRPKKKEVCKRGHPRTPENTRTWKQVHVGVDCRDYVQIKIGCRLCEKISRVKCEEKRSGERARKRQAKAGALPQEPPAELVSDRKEETVSDVPSGSGAGI